MSASNLVTVQSYEELRRTRKTITPARRIAEIRHGYPSSLVGEITDQLDLTKRETLQMLGVNQTTLSRLVKAQRMLDQPASERVERLATLESEATEVLGSREEAVSWLKTRNLALGDESPLSLLDTEAGAQQVRRVLAAIHYGGVV